VAILLDEDEVMDEMANAPKATRPRAVVIFSGGMDSTVLVYDLIKDHDVHALTFMYGQRHGKEVEYAVRTARELNMHHHIVPLHNLGLLLGGSALTDRDIAVPEGHYTAESMKATIVPNRNAIMLSIAYGHAVAIKAEKVATAVHAGDHAIYPDCRKDFLGRLEKAFMSGNNSGITIYAPYVDKTKANICAYGAHLNVPFDKTWSCYKGGTFHCGVCGTCVERKEAFELTGTKDPTYYQET
jgi:7-cyano-7-deazaguanine synthase